MNNKLQPVRGTKDILPVDYVVHNHIINIAKNLGVIYNYKPIDTPIFEFTEIFQRSLGDTSDVVSKEMYSFNDRGGDSITLRPEFTAGIARSLISNGLVNQLPLKFFSYGPLFRYERPQKGRYRQLHQINFEYFGISSPFADSEIIALAVNILRELEILKDTSLELNSLGDAESKKKYHKALIDYFSDHKNYLSEESKIRLEKNPLRILDSKDEDDRKLIKQAPICYEYYNNYSIDFFEQVKNNLNSLKIDFNINPYLVRGLDYYCHTVFEFTTNKLGTQGTVLGGGRYDYLIKTMSKYDVPAIGFAAGIERLFELISYKPNDIRPIAVIAIDNQYEKKVFDLAQKLRSENFVTEIIYGNDLGKKIKYANKINCHFAIFIGEEEFNNNNFKIKNLDRREEKILNYEEINKYFESNYS